MNAGTSSRPVTGLTATTHATDRAEVLANTAAVQRAIDAAAAAGGGFVDVPNGTYSIVTIDLRSGVLLRLAPNAVLRAWGDVNDYPEPPDDDSVADAHGRTKNRDAGRTDLVRAYGCSRTGIVGTGTIDGNGFAFWDRPLRELAKEGHTKESLGLPPHWEDDSPFWRQHDRRVSPLVEFRGCSDVLVRHVTIASSPGWTLHLVACDRVRVERITIANHLYGPNTDGIDINGCRDVMIHGCDLTCGDDAIILKAFREARSCEHVTVTQCTIRTHCAALGIGAEVNWPIRDVVFADCSVPKALRILQIELWTAGLVENVTLSNVTGANMTDIPLERPVYVDVQHHGRDDGELGHVRGILVSGLSAVTRGRIVLTAADGATIEDVTLRDIDLFVPEVEDPEVSVPGSRSSQMSNDSPESRAKRALVVADNVHRLLVSGLRVRWPDHAGRRYEADSSAAARALRSTAEHGLDYSRENGLGDDRRKLEAVRDDVPMGLFYLRRCEGVRIDAPFAGAYGGATRIETVETHDVREVVYAPCTGTTFQ